MQLLIILSLVCIHYDYHHYHYPNVFILSFCKNVLQDIVLDTQEVNKYCKKKNPTFMNFII